MATPKLSPDSIHCGGCQRIHDAFETLESSRRKLVEFTELTGKEISLLCIEARYGEYFVADRMIELGWHISKLGGSGVDIRAQKQGKTCGIEVKTSRFVKRFEGAREGLSWDVLDTQWKGKEFDQLVAVAMDLYPAPRAMLFSYDQVLRFFPLASFVRDNDPKRRRHIDHRKLDLCRSYEDWKLNLRRAKKAISLKTEHSAFEEKLNRATNEVFERHDFSRLSKGL